MTRVLPDARAGSHSRERVPMRSCAKQRGGQGDLYCGLHRLEEATTGVYGDGAAPLELDGGGGSLDDHPAPKISPKALS
jgi:hypothetical protein